MADVGEQSPSPAAPTAARVDSMPPRRRVVLLGASNLTRGISTVVETARQACGGPLDIFTALGHGRSYGMTSSVLGRTLPGILQCGLWEALAALPPAPTAALVTDVGNDIVYGAPVEMILQWVEECVQRLESLPAGSNGCEDRVPIVLTLPPTATVTALSERRYLLLRRCLFPGCRLSRNEAFSRTKQLDEGLVRLAEEHGLRSVRPRVEWFGFDPIHVRMRHWAVAWSEAISLWNDAAQESILARGSFARWIYLRSRAPAERTIFGRQRRAAQPCGRLRDGTTIAIY